MANQKISALPTITGANMADNDKFVLVDTSGDATVATTREEFFKNTPSIGIGVSSPESTMHLKGNGSVTTALQVESASTGYAPKVLFDGIVGAVADNLLGEVSASWDVYTNKVSAIRFESGVDTTNKDDGLISFWTSSSASTVAERMRISPVGNVGIGAISPSSTFRTSIYGDGSSIIGGVEFRNATGGGSTFTVGHASATSPSAKINVVGAGNLVLQTNDTEAMRIDSAGNVGIGTEVATYLLTLSSPDNGTIVAFQKAGVTSGSIAITDNSVSYNSNSDYRLKTDAQPMIGAIERVQALNPVNFEWLSNGNRVDGFLAHEAQEVVPEAVTGERDAMRDEEYEVTPEVLDDDGNVTTEAVMGTRSVPDYQAIDQSKIIPLLTACLQESLAEISSLKLRVEALEG